MQTSTSIDFRPSNSLRANDRFISNFVTLETGNEPMILNSVICVQAKDWKLSAVNILSLS